MVQLQQPADDARQLSAELIDWCRRRLSKFKCPRRIEFVAELPRNESGKLLKRIVKARYWPDQGGKMI